jgi:prolyl 4-hydroxylase
VSAPYLVVVDDFLDAATCRQLNAELEFTWWQRSTVVNRNRSGTVVSFRSRTRTSWSAQEEYFSAELVELLGAIEGRMCAAYDLRRPCLEPWQAIRYDPGGHFDLHHDGGLFGADVGGERRTTVLLYLQTPEAGGETEFPDLGRTVTACAGRLVLWRNLTADGDIDQRLRHRALPVLAGHKAVLTTWERQHSTNRAITPTTKGRDSCPARTTSSPQYASATDP